MFVPLFVVCGGLARLKKRIQIKQFFFLSLHQNITVCKKSNVWGEKFNKSCILASPFKSSEAIQLVLYSHDTVGDCYKFMMI